MIKDKKTTRQTKKKKTQKPNDTFIDQLIATIYQIFDVFKEERRFIILITVLFLVAGIVYPYPGIAMWFGFLLAAYSAVANDSIQTIGTFIASNADRKWYILWLFIGGIFLITVTFSWLSFDGDVSYQRLLKYEPDGRLSFPHPESFSFLQIAAPIFLFIITRLRMPVSTTFLLLSCFAVSPSAIGSVLNKSITAYFLAFGLGFLVWISITGLTKKYFKGKPATWWTIAQWITSGSLWSVWIMQDAANIAIYLPRQLGFFQFLGFACIVFFGLGLLFYLKGDKIQQIVNEKSEVTDIRAATIIDLVYAGILVYKLMDSRVPMSTTWVFIGLLGGREIAMRLRTKHKLKPALRMIGKDAGLAIIGLIVSIVLAMAVNPDFQQEIINLFR